MAKLVTNYRPAGEVLHRISFLSVLGGGLGFAGFVVGALILETYYMPRPVGPMLTYGQQAGIISLPLCTLLGAAIGVCVAIACSGRFVASAVLLLLAGSCGSGVVAALWSSQIARYGRDPSEIVLYYPPLAVCGIAFLLSLVVLPMALFRKLTTGSS